MTTHRIAFATLGCKVNQAETDALVGQFAAAGYQVVDFDEPADVYVVNTCTVTHIGDRKSRQLLRRAARRNPRALVVAAGCYATVDPAGLRALPEVGLVVPTADKPRLLDLITAHLAQPEPSGATAPSPTSPAPCLLPPTSGGPGRAAPCVLPPTSGGPGRAAPCVLPPAPCPLPPASFRTRALVKVQDGCADCCTYCIVPLARGQPRSRPLPDVLDEVQARWAEGHQEIVLTGIHLGRYGTDLGPGTPGLTDLVRAILAETGLPRLRLSSIEPQDFSPALLDLWRNPRVCRHLALPLQSGCDATLARMGRRYTAADFAALVRQVRAAVPQVAITTDVIAGFPGETDADHSASLEFARAMAFARIHVFPYSRRRGTPAAAMPNQVHPAVKQARARAFRALGDEGGRRYRSQFVGQVADVLWEAPDPRSPGRWEGYTDTYIRVTATSPHDLAGHIVPVLLTAITRDGMAADWPMAAQSPKGDS